MDFEVSIEDSKNIDFIKKQYYNSKNAILNKQILYEKYDNIFFCFGMYFQFVEKDYDKMLRCYEISIKSNNSNAINNIGIYHNKITKNYDEMKKYYLMAIDLNNNNAMHNLGCYYEKIEKNYHKMKKYYLMAINQNNCNSMNNLALYYINIENNYNLMLKYHLKAIEMNNSNSLFNLELFFQYNLIKLYNLLKQQKNINNLINQKINQLEKIISKDIKIKIE